MENAKEKTQKPAYHMASNCAFMIRRAWRGCKSVLAICVGLILCGTAASLLELFVVPAILDTIGQGAGPGRLASLILWFTAGMVGVRTLRGYLEANAIFGRIHLRSELGLDVHMAFCRTAYPHTEDPGYLKLTEKAAHSLGDNSSAGEHIWTTLVELLTHAACFLLYLLLLIRVGPWLALLCVSLSAAGYFAGEHIRAWRYRHREEESALEHKSQYMFSRSQDIKLAKDIRIFGIGPWLTELYEKYIRLYQSFYARACRHELWAGLLDVTLALLRNGVAYGLLIAMALEGRLTAAQFVLYFTAVSGFTQWVAGLFTGLGELHRQSLDLSTLRSFLETSEPFRFAGGKPLPVQAGHLYRLELRDVSFRYPGAGEDTLSHVNLTIRPGEKLAVVGHNGAGKTTLIKLLCGLYDPTEGQVLLDGADIRQFDRRDYYRHFSAVFQQFSIMAGTIAENVAQSTTVDLPRMWDCLERAGVAGKIRELPQKEDTHLGREVYLDGVDLSGGQLQRLMLARALYKNAPVVVLDEPTAALDPIAESDLYQKYNTLTGDRTSVYISHRLASTRFCDRVLLIENGGIAEEGTHEELLKAGGRYAYLFHIQSKYYQEGAMEDA
ncbi:ABC transporter ATP-binding protein [Acutalibacter caecimuris]|uniref:ABC transporter ATP-binding protein n=1 Tax=Acutalibacter caecimuris TaxID=3093657 RepID=UPI002AC92BE5|nr:ABC transporter ATP-binding protein [Acutalibacter sp. M00118]